MISSFLSHHHLKHIRKHSALSRLYWSYGIIGFATALISVIGPIYLYRIGYSIQWIFSFFILTALIKVVLLPFVFKMIATWGSYKTMAIGTLFLALSYLSFGTLETFHWSIIIMASLKAVANAFYYPSFRVSFAQDCNKDSVGRQITKLNSILLLLGAIAPLVGGIVATVFGPAILFTISSGLFFAVMIVLFTTKRPYTKTTFSLRKIPRKDAIKDYASNAFYSASGLPDMLAWPLIVSFIVPSYTGIGALGSILVGTSVVLSLWIGSVEDKKGEKLFAATGSALSTAYASLRILAASAVHLVGLGVLSSIGSVLLSSSYESRYYKNVDDSNSLEYLFAMDMANSLPWLVYFPLLLGLSYSVSTLSVFYIGVVIAAPMALGTMLVRFHKNSTPTIDASIA